jgi:hypothetical protein
MLRARATPEAVSGPARRVPERLAAGLALPKRAAGATPRQPGTAAVRSGGFDFAALRIFATQSTAERVEKVVHSAGLPLEPAVRARMERSLNQDFSRVRVHADDRAAVSALALDARAYTLGSHIVFGHRQYAPSTSAGDWLLAHELAHVAGHRPDTVGKSLRVAAPDAAEERAATAVADRVARGAAASPELVGAARPTERGVIHRSVLGGILGGLGGLVGGALLGGLLLGPVGAVLGGIAGLVGGALLANKATTRSRPLTADEIAYAREVFQDSIDYSKITITRDSLLAAGAPRTLGNTINLKSDWGHFKEDTLELTEQGKTTLIHEMGHVWQYQNGGLRYIPDSIIAQIKAAIGGGSRNVAYDWQAADAAGTPWEKWNPEQQAAAIEDYNKLLRRSQAPDVTLEELAQLSRLMKYIEKVRAREGAPGSSPRPQPGPSPAPAG